MVLEENIVNIWYVWGQTCHFIYLGLFPLFPTRPTKPWQANEARTKTHLHAEIQERDLEKMGVFTFVCKASGGEWTAKQLKGELEASASSTYDLQRKLVQAALAEDCSGGVQSSFSYVLPTSAVFQVSHPSVNSKVMLYIQ